MRFRSTIGWEGSSISMIAPTRAEADRRDDATEVGAREASPSVKCSRQRDRRVHAGGTRPRDAPVLDAWNVEPLTGH